jgi:hypothetical protein
MSDTVGQFRINLNQNLWGLIVGLLSLGAAEYYTLCTLFWFSVAVSTVMLASIVVTTLAYTITYWKNKSKSE